MIHSDVVEVEQFFSDLFAERISNHSLCREAIAVYLAEATTQPAIRKMVVALLQKYYPVCSDVAPPKKSVYRENPFEKALSQLIEGQSFSLGGTTFFERLVIVSLSFFFDRFDVIECRQLSVYLHHRYLSKPGEGFLFLLTEKEARNGSLFSFGYLLINLIEKAGLFRIDPILKTAFTLKRLEEEKNWENEFALLAEIMLRQMKSLVLPSISSLPPANVHAPLKLFENGKFAVKMAFEGKNSGIGTLSFNEVSIITFGPQVLDLGEMEKYGIEFFSRDETHLSTKEEGSLFSCRGWSRLVADKDVWIEHDLRVDTEKVDLYITYESFNPKAELAECFFIDASAVFVDGHLIRKGSLDKYRGNARQVELRGKNENIKVTLSHHTVCQVIPLAGGSYFWGANFILSIEPENLSKRLHITFF